MRGQLLFLTLCALVAVAVAVMWLVMCAMLWLVA
jgi:hypothetical protein